MNKLGNLPAFAQIRVSSARVRLSFDMPVPVRQHIQSLADRAHSGNKAELVRHALAIYETLVEHHADGGLVVLRSADGGEHLLSLAAI